MGVACHHGTNPVAFGAMGILCGAVCSAGWVLSYAIGAVFGGHNWCMTIAIVAGVGHSMTVMADCIHRFVLWETCSRACWMAKWFTTMSASLLQGVLNGFAKELSHMVVGTGDTVMQLMLVVLIIDHLAMVHQCLDVCNEILEVLSQPGYDIFSFSRVHMGDDIVCHSLLDSVKEGRSFHLGHFLFLFTAHRHPLCKHLQGFGSQGCKDISEVVLTVRHDAVEEEPVLQGMPDYGEGVVGVFWVPVVGGQADRCCSSHQCTSNGISCGLGRLGDELLWGWFWGHVSSGQISKTRGRTQKWL